MIVMIDKRRVSGEEMIVRVEVEDGVEVGVWTIKKRVVTNMNAEDDLVRKGGRRRGKGPGPLDAGALHIHPHHLLHHHLGLVLEIERGSRSTQTEDQRRVRSATGATNLIYLMHHRRRRLVMTEIENDERRKREDTSREVPMTRVIFVTKVMLSVNNQNKSIKIHRYKLILLRRKHPQSLVKVVQTQPVYLLHQLQLNLERP